MGKKKKVRKPKPKAPKQNMRKMLAEAQMMQKRLEQTQAELSKVESVFEKDGIKVKMQGTDKVLELKIDPKLLADIPDLELKLQTVLNEAKSAATAQANALEADISIPSSFDQFFK